MNIAIIAGQLVVGGAEQQLYMWLKNLDRQRFNPSVVTLHPGHGDYWEAPIEALDIPLYRIPQRLNRIRRLLEIIKILQKHQPDLIHGWHTFASPYAGLCAKFLKTKSLGGIRSSFPAVAHSKEAKLTHLFCDAIIANSYTTAQAYQVSLRRHGQRVYTVQNGLETNFFSREVARAYFVANYGVPKDAIWVATIGRMHPLKRFDLLLHLVAGYVKNDTETCFIFIGDGPEKPALESLSSELKISDRVIFTSEVPEIGRMMKGFDVFCFPSIDEGMPNVIMEAAAAALPIAAWRYPFIEEILVDGQMTMLVEPGDVDGMGAALRTLINNPQLRQQLGANAQKHITSTFNLNRYIQEMTAVYRNLLYDQ